MSNGLAMSDRMLMEWCVGGGWCVDDGWCVGDGLVMIHVF